MQQKLYTTGSVVDPNCGTDMDMNMDIDLINYKLLRKNFSHFLKIPN
jgi:hypothetical protein